MNPYAELISKEEAKLELLRKKVAACEQLIAALRGTDTDDVDAAISKQIGQKSVALDGKTKDSQQSAPVIAGMRTRKDSIAPLVLQYLGMEGKKLDDIEAYMISIGKQTTRGSLRTMLMNLRVTNGLVESPSAGFYKLSKAGAKAIGLDLV
ncbi:MAG: hypothetical protein HY846_03525 [Nitrosomonadales bacterium]|nr:hypothetical protein [Nitrosomonadales bacterium]